MHTNRTKLAGLLLAAVPCFGQTWQGFTLVGNWTSADVVNGPIVAGDAVSTAQVECVCRSIAIQHTGGLQIQVNFGSPVGVFDDSNWQYVATMAPNVDGSPTTDGVYSPSPLVPSPIRLRLISSAVGNKVYGVKAQ